MKRIFQFSGQTNARFIGVENTTVELNASVVDKFRKEQEKVDEEKRLKEAELAALRAMPEFARDLIGQVEGKSKTERLEEYTRNRVFGALDEAGNANADWGNDYQTVVDIIRDRRTDALLSVENVKRAEQTLSGLQGKYQQRLEQVIAQKDKTEEFRRRFFKGRWYTAGLSYKKESTGSEQSRMKVRGDVVKGIFEEIKHQVENRKADAEDFTNRTKDMLSAGFETLTPDQKTTFLTMVQQEIGGAVVVWGPPPYNRVVEYTERQHRLEAYKKLGWNPDYLNQEAEVLENDQQGLRDGQKESRDKVNGLNPNLDTIRANMGDVEADTSAPNLKTLLAELDQYITTQGNINREALFQDFADNKELDDSAIFLVYSAHLEGEADLTKDMPKTLKKKYLAFINKIQGEERPDRLDSYSGEFEGHHNEVEILYDDARELLDVDLVAVKEAINLDDAVYQSINDFIQDVADQKSVYEQAAISLDPQEKEILDAYFSELSKVVEKLGKLEKTWRKERAKYDEYDIKKSDWDIAKGGLDAALAAAIAVVVPVGSPPEHHNTRTANINAAQANLQTHLGKEPILPEFTLVSSEFSDERISITTKNADIATRKTLFGGAPNSWKNRVLNSLKTTSAKENNDKYRKKLEGYQSRRFDMVLSSPEGTRVTMDFEKYAIGKDFACDDVLTRPANPIGNLRILSKTADALVLRQTGTNKIVVLQKTSGASKVNALIFDNLPGYVAGTEIEPNFKFPDHANEIGEPMSLTFA
jgi:hypothetical protein